MTSRTLNQQGRLTLGDEGEKSTEDDFQASGVGDCMERHAATHSKGDDSRE